MFCRSAILVLFCAVSTWADCPAEMKTILNTNMKNNVDNGCGVDWQYFARPSGGWCIKVFPGKLFSRDDAEAKCKAEGSVLTSLQNKDEVAFIQAATLAQISTDSGSLWIGTKRTAKCTGVVGATAACTNMTAFEWTDGSATGTAGFVFQNGQPDNASKDQNCALLLASKKPTITARGTYYAGTMDDVPCALANFDGNAARQTSATACGKKASK